MVKPNKFTKTTLKKPKLELMGSVKITSNLKTASKRIADEFRIAIKKSGKNYARICVKERSFCWVL